MNATNLKVYFLSIMLSIVVLLGTTACAGGEAPAYESSAAAPPAEVEYEAVAEEEVAYEEAASDAEFEAAEEAMEEEAASESEASPSAGSTSPVSNRPNVYNRLIIKNAEVALTVEDTDTAVNRSLGIVTEYDGYVVSNRTWFGEGLKYATVTIGVPAENFEEMLRRLKDLAVTVDNESVSGKDVTDEFVDLESRLRNLDATADRIRTFMDQAKDVDESLEVSAQLSEIEAEIEQVKGRMVYLKDRASFSTCIWQMKS